MKCSRCDREFPERELHLSHDVPCYMFEGKDRREKKQEADKHGRRWLCRKHHDMDEKMVFAVMVDPLSKGIKNEMRKKAKEFSKRWSDGFLY